MVARRLVGETVNAAPVLTLITQFGGGKTHTLTALYHLVKNHEYAKAIGSDLRRTLGVENLPEQSRVAVFVGNAWDPSETRETPWIDIARQLAGDAGVAALGSAARTMPPGTEAIGRVIEKAGGSVLILFDEVLNFLNRHRNLAEGFYAFIQDLTVAMTGARGSACVISLPRSQVEMSESDVAWQERITKVVKRVAKDLLVNDEAEISEVMRRRLFEDLGKESTRKAVARTYADWCFDHRSELPPEWTAVDSSATEAKARDYLRTRFEVCYLDRHWPEAFKAIGAWPLKSLRQAFLDGSLDRVINPDEYLKRKVPEFVANGDFGLASGDQPGGGFDRVWFREFISPDEVAFDAGVYLLRRDAAEAARAGLARPSAPVAEGGTRSEIGDGAKEGVSTATIDDVEVKTDEKVHILTITGAIPPELWNKVGIRIIPKLRSTQTEPHLAVNFDLEIKGDQAAHMVHDLQQALVDLGLSAQVAVVLK
jgi:hypothetical protein